MELGLAKGKRKADKRESLKQKKQKMMKTIDNTYYIFSSYDKYHQCFSYKKHSKNVLCFFYRIGSYQKLTTKRTPNIDSVLSSV